RRRAAAPPPRVAGDLRPLGAELPRRRLAWPETCGQRATTDQDGIAQLPPTRHSWLCAARADGWFGFAIVPPGERTVTIALAVDENVTIEVRDEAGRPAAEVPVVIVQDLKRRERNGRDAIDRIWNGATDRGGRAVARHFQFARRSAENAGGERFAAGLQIATAQSVLAGFAGNPATEDVVHLTLPPLCGLDVQLTDHRGRPLLAPANVFFGPVAWKAAEGDLPDAPSLAHVRVEKPVGGLPVHLPWLAAGVPLRPSVHFRHVGRPSVGEHVKLPIAGQPEGTASRIELPLSAAFGLYAGRLVFASGEPVADRTIEAVLWHGFETSELELHTTDDGEFDIPQLGRDEPELTLELRLEVTASDTDEGAAATLVGCRVPVRPPAGGERRELGDLVLDTVPVLCTGVVVDDRGEPVAGATVVAQRRGADPDLERFRARIQGANLDAAQLERFRRALSQRTNPWRDITMLRATTDAAGAFAISGAFPRGTELRVRADTRQHIGSEAPWSGIGQRFHLVIARNGVLRGRALLPAGLPQDCASLTLQPLDEAGQPGNARGGPRRVGLGRRRGGRFAVEPLHAGRYDAIVKLRGVPSPVLTIPDVLITPGECRDPRLAVIDLRQSVFRYVLRAVDYGGNPMPVDSPLVLRWRREDGEIEHSALRWRKGRADFFAGSSLVELVSFAPGCEPLELQLSPGDQDVAMKRLVPAQLVLPGARQLIGPGRKVRVSTILVGDSGYPQWLRGEDQRSGESFSFQRWELGKSTGAWLEHNDLVEVPIVKPGKYQIVLRVHATESERSQQVSLSLGEYDLQVDGSKLSPVTVALDPQQVQELLAQLRPVPPAGSRPGRGGR
ncbi:MAG: hypothetical protein KDE27_07600, partial [Planctomycetes bacterium]|nr:hypothetical protein [Planctomycetota bacterium]